MAMGSVVYVTADIDPAKTVGARHQPCECPMYVEDMPIREWSCEHGNYFRAVNP